ncbi:sugar ABC transporter substrate-binding protein [Nitrincola nitratireducens]|uniref:D-ribose-binding periplasmic protein n=1 Tax=Nitrincola nitratireducens TaxID=1229521 RepID=W9UWX5_9GAMM|nr:sugar ABC transporter substrate-binding protein [Nitrincola nitratireducens]EXJ09236.1 D-ribose-binding periplasmic protein precursor [Nitrincola nitratireducens]
MNLKSGLLALAASTALLSPLAFADKAPIVGLITKTNTNPFFVKMREGAQQRADETGVELRTFSGRFDGDNESQVQAIENLIAAGAKGILIAPSDPVAVVPAIDRARAAGLLVIALDTPLSPADAADATFATDNYKAGVLIGQWAAQTLGDKAADARIAMLNLNSSMITVDVARNQGFMEGFGIDVNDPNRIGDEKDPRIAGQDVTSGAEEGGRRAMENLLQRDPSINVVYTINEPAAAGAYEALRAVGREKDVLIVSVDGGCPGVENVRDNVIGATSMQFPLQMASMGVDAVIEFAKTGQKPQASEGLDFVNTGVELITDQPQEGLDSKRSAEGLELCWG